MQQFVSDIPYDGERNMMTGREDVQLMTALEKKEAPEGCPLLAYLGSPTWARTRDLRINSPALYQLSYRGMAIECSLNRCVVGQSGCG